MLVIRRRAGQSVLIGEDIEIEIIEATSGKVKLGIKAPREIPVLRSEIKLIGEQNRLAAGGVSPEAVETLLQRLEPPAGGQVVSRANNLPGDGVMPASQKGAESTDMRSEG